MHYDHKRIEKKWQKVWKETGLYKTREPKRTTPASADGGAPFIKGDTTTPNPSLEKEGRTSSASQPSKVNSQKCYVLDMFPYPSGDGLHVGHPKGYIATDVYSRLKKMQGHSILHPMGWDAFGLPAENYAIKNKVHPAVAVKKNIKQFKKQLLRIGFNYDWSREINTTDPNYYRWTQWIFLQMFHKGLAYRSNEPINWCPSCKTGLANEDLEDGKCERCGSVVEKRAIPQWVLKITDYADRLLADLGKLDWPEYIKESQKNWIGRSEGINITYDVIGLEESVTVFTTRPDTNFGATFIVAAPDSKFVTRNLERFPEKEAVSNYCREASQRSDIERMAEGKKKTGVFTGLYALNQLNQKKLPIYVGDFVIGNVGTGVVVGVPGHDKRDFEFAQAMGIEVVRVVVGADGEKSPITRIEQVQEETGTMVNSGLLDGMEINAATKRIIDYLVEKKWGTRIVNYKLRDWVFSRQRYWGEPIPLIFCENCKKLVGSTKQNHKSKIIHHKSFSEGELQNPGWIAVPENKLPVKLPNVKSYEPTGTGESPLAVIESFVNTTCPKCGGPAKRETNTMPQWAGSCWYYLAYVAKQNSEFRIQNSARLRRWLPVDMYVGGAEHATRHLIYARFWHKFLFDIGAVSIDEPFQRLQNVGLILAQDGRKMSKRFGNVINPDEIVERFGADSLRVYEMFMGPFNQAIAWSTDSLVGSRRFLEKVWRLREKIQNTVHKNQTPNSKAKLATGQAKHKAQNPNIEPLLNQTIKKVGDDIEAFRFNTAVSALMILLNALEKESGILRETFKIFITLLAPFAPHLSEELFAHLGYKKSVHLEPWPVYSEKIAVSASATIVVQVSGKVRGSFTATRGESKEYLEKTARELPSVQKWTEGKIISTIIVVPDRLVNIVVTEPKPGKVRET